MFMYGRWLPLVYRLSDMDPDGGETDLSVQIICFLYIYSMIECEL